MANIIFKYLDSVGVVHSGTYDTLFVRGFDIPYKFKLVPDRICELMDGSKKTQYKGFQRIIGIELAPINSNEDFLRSFLQAESKSATYQGVSLVSEEAQTVWEEIENESEWLDEFKYTKQFKFELTESVIRTVWELPVVPSENMIGYIKTKVLITGTQTSPETFTTNAGKLQYNYGTTVYPTISLLSYNVSIIANGAPYQERKVNQVGDVAQSGSNITFQLALSDIGNDSADGNSYTDIVIVLQAIL